MPSDEAVRAIRAWTRLDGAFASFNRALERSHGVTGAQLAMLRLLVEWGGAMTLAEMRARLVLHPATLGQLVDRLARRGLVALAQDGRDRRRRVVTVTVRGREVCGRAPLAGPVRLRHESAPTKRVRRLANALEDAVALFGLEDHTA